LKSRETHYSIESCKYSRYNHKWVIILKSIVIGENDAGQRLDKFLTKTYPNLPQSMLYKSIRKKDIKCNGKRCEISTRLCKGDTLTMYLKDEFFQKEAKDYDFLKAPNQLNILYEDENLLLLDKKPGLLVHPDEHYHFDSLIARIQHYLYEKKEYRPDEENSFAPALVNRIDRNTGGIVIAAKNAETLRILNDKMKHRELEKKYLCVVHGRLKKKEDTLTAYLEKKESQNRVYISHKPTDQTKTIRTRYRVLKEQGDYSLLEVDLLTGRTHQIRAHLASIGHPLAGDGKYGTNALNKQTGWKYQALYSYKLKFCFTSPAGALEYLNGKEFESGNVWFLKEWEQFLSKGEENKNFNVNQK
jgi:23S rRNA pseudouridine955/2504/2580 synthase